MRAAPPGRSTPRAKVRLKHINLSTPSQEEDATRDGTARERAEKLPEMGHQFFELFFFSSVPGRRRRLPRRRASAPLLFSLTFSLQLHNQPINQNNDRGRPDASVHQDRSGEAGQAAAPPGVQGAEVWDSFFFFFFSSTTSLLPLPLSLFAHTRKHSLSPSLPFYKQTKQHQ